MGHRVESETISLTKGGNRLAPSWISGSRNSCADEHLWREQVGNLLHVSLILAFRRLHNRGPAQAWQSALKIAVVANREDGRLSITTEALADGDF